MTAFLLDVNVLIALMWPAHEGHARVQHWFRRNSRGGWATCPLTQAAFVRIIANPAFSPDAVTPQEATKLLSERTGCPTLPRIPSKPMLHLCMALLGRPHQRDQHIDIQQKGRHSCSAYSSWTIFVLTRGDSAGRSKTCRPLTERLGGGSENPRRTSSDTAFPSRSDRLSALFA